MGEATSWRDSRAWFERFVIRAVVILGLVALIAAWILYALSTATPFATLNPVTVYNKVLEIKRDWPAFERQVPEGDRENHREILALMKRTDAGVLALVALGFDLALIIIALQLILVVIGLFIVALIIYLYLLYLDGQSPKATEVRAA